jgi:preprotein translocase subunit SecD
MNRTRMWAVIILVAAVLLGAFVYVSEFDPRSQSSIAPLYSHLALKGTSSPAFVANYPLRLGLDLQGGTRLVYRADTKDIDAGDAVGLMSALRDVIERRVNIFGVSEPIVQVETRGFGDSREDRLVVELPGVTNIDKAVELIGDTPVLEFRTERPDGQTGPILEAQAQGQRLTEDAFIPTKLTGRYLKRASVEFQQQGTLSPLVALEFNAEGEKLFAEITRNNIGKYVAIYLDGLPISIPVVRDEITSGKAIISGSFTPQDARALAGRLNSGALPVDIELISSQAVGASLGADALHDNLLAALYGFLIVSLFLILWYRLPGVLAVLALSVYVVISVAIFKLMPVVMTSAGIAGFILSIGMAVDANILIFERAKEEMKRGRTVHDAFMEGFSRAWPSIRDSNVASMITASVLFWMGTSVVKGFALTFGLGVIVSMFTAITVTRTFLNALPSVISRTGKFLMSSGVTR